MDLCKLVRYAIRLENTYVCIYSDSSIANLLQCDVMMTILTTVLDRAIDLTSNSFAENHLQEVS